MKILKEYPKTITLKTGIIFGVGALLLLVVMVLIFNMHNSTKQQANEATPQVDKNVTAAANVNWYKNQEVHKSTPIAQPTKTTSVPKVTTVGNDNNETSVAQNTLGTKEATDEMKKIQSAPIAANQINDTSAPPSPTTKVVTAPNQSSEAATPKSDDPNLQGEKKTFLKMNSLKDDDYLQEGLKNPFSPYEVKAGTVIPAILITGINSDLPGQITAQVRQNVYDTIAGKYVLIPQGAKLTGLYDSQIAYGQSRVLIVWKRIIYPNGQSIDLDGMPGADMSGYAGFNDQVNNHYMKIFGSVILMSAISAGAQLSQPKNDNNNNNNPTINQTLAASLGTNIMNSANMVLQKNLGIQPTLVIRPGYLMNVSVTKDIVFPSAYQEGTTYAN